jgi:hypothetical protein
MFNRAQAANPSAVSPTGTRVIGVGTAPNSGFGSINYTLTGQAPRQGQMVLRMSF